MYSFFFVRNYTQLFKIKNIILITHQDFYDRFIYSINKLLKFVYRLFQIDIRVDAV